ncbi:hypothetical protein, partial [Pseudomonas aeruginosa]|uniref:hypothetical protein n=1 Tax=Pseudomonas aeruginosa TaxID=287 RepID=UPI001F4B352A
MQTLNQDRDGPLRWAFYITLFLLLAAILPTCAAYGAENAELTILKQLKTYEIDSVSTILDDAMRKIGFGIAKFLGGLADSLYDSIGKIYKLLTFGNSEQMVSLVRR